MKRIGSATRYTVGPSTGANRPQTKYQEYFLPRFLTAFLLLACSAPLGAQEPGPPPALLLDAAHCLATAPGDLLHLGPKEASIELGYVDDEKSYPGQDSLVVIQYTVPTHTRGTAFRVMAEKKSRHPTIGILYSVGFRQSDDGSQQVHLLDSPLGGIGAQDEILAAIHRIGFHTFSIPAPALLAPSNSARCEAEPLP
jgi:hypothetical protein